MNQFYFKQYIFAFIGKLSIKSINIDYYSKSNLLMFNL